MLQQRMTAARGGQFLDSPPADKTWPAASVFRASSNLTAIDEFYTKGLGSSVSRGGPLTM